MDSVADRTGEEATATSHLFTSFRSWKKRRKKKIKGRNEKIRVDWGISFHSRKREKDHHKGERGTRWKGGHKGEWKKKVKKEVGENKRKRHQEVSPLLDLRVLECLRRCDIKYIWLVVRLNVYDVEYEVLLCYALLFDDSWFCESCCHLHLHVLVPCIQINLNRGKQLNLQPPEPISSTITTRP